MAVPNPLSCPWPINMNKPLSSDHDMDMQHNVNDDNSDLLSSNRLVAAADLMSLADPQPGEHAKSRPPSSPASPRLPVRENVPLGPTASPFSNGGGIHKPSMPSQGAFSHRRRTTAQLRNRVNSWVQQRDAELQALHVQATPKMARSS